MKKIILFTLFCFSAIWAVAQVSGLSRDIEHLELCDDQGGGVTVTFYRVFVYTPGSGDTYILGTFDEDGNPYIPSGTVTVGACSEAANISMDSLNLDVKAFELIPQCVNDTSFYTLLQVDTSGPTIIGDYDLSGNSFSYSGTPTAGFCGATGQDFEVVRKCDLIQRSLVIQGTATQSNDTVTFANTSVYPSGDAVANIYWDFGDGTTADQNLPNTHIYSGLPDGNYYARLVIEMQSGFSNHVNWTIQVRNDSIISISADPSTVWGYYDNNVYYEFTDTTGTPFLVLDDDGTTYTPANPGFDCRKPKRTIPPLSTPPRSVNFSELCSTGFLDTISTGDSIVINAPTDFCRAQSFSIICNTQESVKIVLDYGTYTDNGKVFSGNKTTFLTSFATQYFERWDVAKINQVKITNLGASDTVCTYKLSNEFRKYQ